MEKPIPCIHSDCGQLRGGDQTSRSPSITPRMRRYWLSPLPLQQIPSGMCLETVPSQHVPHRRSVWPTTARSDIRGANIAGIVP